MMEEIPLKPIFINQAVGLLDGLFVFFYFRLHRVALDLVE